MGLRSHDFCEEDCMRRLLVPLLAVLVALFIGACGSDNNDNGGSNSTASSGSGGKTGGSIKIDQTSFPDYLDPALSYTVDGWEAMNGAYPGLLTYAHVEGQDGAKVVPGPG